MPSVLLVDDEDRFRENMVKILRLKGLDAEGVAGGLDALEITKKRDFDVLILDMKLQDISGVELLARLRERGIETEVIVLTGHTLVDIPPELAGRGVSDYLLKPASVEDILSRIESVLERGKTLRDRF